MFGLKINKQDKLFDLYTNTWNIYFRYELHAHMGEKFSLGKFPSIFHIFKNLIFEVTF